MSQPPANVGPLPVTLAQEARLLRYARYRDDPSAYNTSSQLATAHHEVTGKLDVERLLTATRLVVAQHSAFNSHFQASTEPGGNFVLVDLPTGFETLVLGEERARGGWDTLVEATVDAAEQPFDLERGPLGRVVVGSATPERHVVSIAIEHIVCDAWALALFADQVARAYADLTPPRPSVSEQHAVDERAWLDGPGGQESREFWKQTLGDVGAVVPLHLPAAQVGSSADASSPRIRTLSVPSDLMDGLSVAARRFGTTSTAFYTAALAGAARDIGADDDLAVICPVLNRNSAADLDRICWASNIVTVRYSSSVPSPISASEAARLYMSAMGHSRYPVHQLDIDLSPEMYGEVHSATGQLYLDPTVHQSAFQLEGLRVSELDDSIRHVLLGFGAWFQSGSDGGIEMTLAHREGYVSDAVGEQLLAAFGDHLRRFAQG